MKLKGDGNKPSMTTNICTGAGSATSLLWTYFVLLLAITLIVAFLVCFGHAPVWYDEANYLVIAGAIRETGYPIWFSDPDKPAFFIDSPPALLYLVSYISKYITNDLFLIRLTNSALFALPAFLSLAIYIQKQALDAMLLSMTALFCAITYFFVIELIQVRMDFPLAALSFMTLVLAALAEEGLKENAEEALANRPPLLTLSLLICASSLLLLMKYQAICVTACLFLSVILYQDFRRLSSWLPLIAHITGLAIGMLLLFRLVISNPFVPSAEAFDHVAFNVKRIVTVNHPSRLIDVTKDILPKIIIPAVIIVSAMATIRRKSGMEPLFRLSLLMVVTVIAFNLAVHGYPQAGHYYMIQAALPLGYLIAHAVNSLLQARRRRYVLIVACMLTVHAL